MTQETTYFGKAVFVVACLFLGWSGAAGCGSDGSTGTPAPSEIDSELPAVYEITSYQENGESCDEVSDAAVAPTYLVLYAFRPNSTPEETRLGGTFCSAVEECRAVADFAGEPTRGYSFIEGTDDAGWTGYGVVSNGPLDDSSRCQAELQVHSLVIGAAGAISIETLTVRPTYDATVDGESASCEITQAIAAVDDDETPCEAILLLEGTREAEL